MEIKDHNQFTDGFHGGPFGDPLNADYIQGAAYRRNLDSIGNTPNFSSDTPLSSPPYGGSGDLSGDLSVIRNIFLGLVAVGFCVVSAYFLLVSVLWIVSKIEENSKGTGDTKQIGGSSGAKIPPPPKESFRQSSDEKFRELAKYIGANSSRNFLPSSGENFGRAAFGCFNDHVKLLVEVMPKNHRAFIGVKISPDDRQTSEYLFNPLSTLTLSWNVPKEEFRIAKKLTVYSFVTGGSISDSQTVDQRWAFDLPKPMCVVP